MTHSHSRLGIQGIVKSMLAGAVALAISLPVQAANVWDGGGADGNWSTLLNWDDDLVPISPSPLTFDGGLNLSTFNDLAFTANGITYNVGAGPFIHSGNTLNIDGDLINNSSALQTHNFTTVWTGNRLIEGGTGSLAFGNITGTAASASMQELSFQGSSGTFNGVFSSGANPDAGLRVRINTAADSDTWSILGNNVHNFGGQILVARGTVNFGSLTDAPNLTMTRVTTGNAAEFFTVGNTNAGATFNMKNGSLTLDDGTGGVGTTSVRFALGNNNTVGATGVFNQTGGTVTLIGFTNGTTPGVFGANQGAAVTAFNISGGTFNAGNANFRVTTRGVGELNLSGTGSVTAGQLTVNDSRGTAAASGIVNLGVGSALEVNQVRMHRTGSVANNGAAIFNFDGGVLKPRSSNSSFWTAFTGSQANVQDGGAIIDSSGFNITIAHTLIHDAALGANPDGGLEKRGLGVLTLNGATTFTGNTRVVAGGLTMGSSATLANTAAVIVDSGAALTIQSANTINNLANLILVDGITLNLNFVGIEYLGALTLNGVNQGNGEWDAADLAILMPNSTFTGTGVLVVPEPSSFAIAGFGLLALIGWKRLRAAK